MSSMRLRTLLIIPALLRSHLIAVDPRSLATADGHYAVQVHSR